MKKSKTKAWIFGTKCWSVPVAQNLAKLRKIFVEYHSSWSNRYRSQVWDNSRDRSLMDDEFYVNDHRSYKVETLVFPTVPKDVFFWKMLRMTDPRTRSLHIDERKKSSISLYPSMLCVATSWVSYSFIWASVAGFIFSHSGKNCEPRAVDRRKLPGSSFWILLRKTEAWLANVLPIEHQLGLSTRMYLAFSALLWDLKLE